MSGEDAPRVEIASRAELRRWLEAHHEQPGSIWLVTWKKHVADKHVPWDDIVEEALCFGWVDSVPRKLDADRTMLRLSPRRPGSGWSAINKERVASLIERGLMAPAGFARIEAAKADGSWCRLDTAGKLEVPPDLAAALAKAVGARDAFDALPPSLRRSTLEWVAEARRPETRTRRIAQIAERAARNERPR